MQVGSRDVVEDSVSSVGKIWQIRIIGGSDLIAARFDHVGHI